MGDLEISTDKYYWHRYLPFYEMHLENLRNPQDIFEYGVFEGDSIRWIVDRYPEATVIGADIIQPLSSWPVLPQVKYVQLDQGDRKGLATKLESLNKKYDLVIEDGSHHPTHQRNCLLETFPYLKPGGIYILEDIHTSQTELRNKGLIEPVVKDWFKELSPLERASAKLWSFFPGFIKRANNKILPKVNCLTFVLALERARGLKRQLTVKEINQLSATQFFTFEEVQYLDGRINKVDIYRRATLPLYCNTCQGEDYDLATLRCLCGRRVYCDDDSMSVVMHIK
jgi:hypothetical protein